MKETVRTRLHARIETDLAQATGDRSIFQKVAGFFQRHYEPRIDALEQSEHTIKAERRALSRKLSQRPDVVLWEHLTLAEVFEMALLREDGLTAAKIAHLFDVPIATVKEVLKASEGKMRDKAVFDAEARRRRSEKLRSRRLAATTRDIDVEADTERGSVVRLEQRN